MRKFILFAVFAALLLTGCNSTSGSSGREAPAQPVAPVAPVYPEPLPPEPAPPSIPDVGVGTVKYAPSCKAGFAKVKYVFRTESTIDTNSFIVIHIVDNQGQDIEQGSVVSNGSVSSMTEDVYILPNDTDIEVAHQIQVKFISDGISQVDTFSFMQPSCDQVAPVDPEDPIDPEPPVEPVGPSTTYAPDTPYAVGNVITIIDAKGVKRTYVCTTAYVSGFQGTWTRFRAKEIDNWTRIANLTYMKVEIQ